MDKLKDKIIIEQQKVIIKLRQQLMNNINIRNDDEKDDQYYIELAYNQFGGNDNNKEKRLNDEDLEQKLYDGKKAFYIFKKKVMNIIKDDEEYKNGNAAHKCIRNYTWVKKMHRDLKPLDLLNWNRFIDPWWQEVIELEDYLLQNINKYREQNIKNLK